MGDRHDNGVGRAVDVDRHLAVHGESSLVHPRHDVGALDRREVLALEDAVGTVATGGCRMRRSTCAAARSVSTCHIGQGRTD